MLDAEPKRSARALVVVVLAEAVGSSITPFVPLPFVDDYLFERLLRRIARKVIDRAGRSTDDGITRAIVLGYVDASGVPLGERALSVAARFLVRKVAMILDVKRSHDVFGEAIVFALALDTTIELGVIDALTARDVGSAIHRARTSLGSAAIEVLTRAGREAFKADGKLERARRIEGTRFARVAQAIGNEVDETHARLHHLMRYEMGLATPL